MRQANLEQAHVEQARVKQAQRPLFALLIFTGSFLLFLIQPMVARLALPLLGGAPNVWNSAMLVYQALLLGGYAYAHLIACLPLRAQFGLHLALLALAALSLPIALADLPSFGPGFEVFWVPALFLMTVGPVFFLVSAQAPLVQRWYAASADAGDPYPLYAASNLGSFTGLLSYPLLFEPLLSLKVQSQIWALGYLALLLLVALVAVVRMRGIAPASVEEASPASTSRIGWRTIALWLALSAVPSGLMLSTTTHLTTDIFAMPLLWVIPLGLYLLSFTVAFAEDRTFATILTRSAPLILLLAGAVAMTSHSAGSLSLALSAVVLLFIVAVALHARLYDARPDPAHLTLFYLVMSAGGVMGGLFTALIAPLAFDWVWEHPILVIASAALIPLGTMPLWQSRIAEHERRRFFAYAVLLPVAVLLSAGMYLAVAREADVWALASLLAIAAIGIALKFNRAAFVLVLVLLMVGRGGLSHIADYRSGDRTRSYFGVYTISDRGNKGMRVLSHGTTIHGQQYLNPARALAPTAYYGETSGVGLVLERAGALYGANAKVGIVGLGAGTLACYRKPEQTYRFYEIDPAILAFSDEGRFTFMERCAPGAVTVIGDARIALEEEPAGQFDVLVVDAFSSDAIPLHLLTVEAMETYGRALRESGVVLIHISNRYVELEPVLSAFARSSGWHAALRADTRARSEGLMPSNWAMLAPRKEALEAAMAATGADRWRALKPPARDIWTDDYASTIPQLKWGRLIGESSQ